MDNHVIPLEMGPTCVMLGWDDVHFEVIGVKLRSGSFSIARMRGSSRQICPGDSCLVYKPIIILGCAATAFGGQSRLVFAAAAPGGGDAAHSPAR